MKYYSEKTKRMYDTEKDLVTAEKELEIAEAEKQKMIEKRKERAEEVEAAFEKANELLGKFIEDYGSFHTTIKSGRSLFDRLFDIW